MRAVTSTNISTDFGTIGFPLKNNKDHAPVQYCDISLSLKWVKINCFMIYFYWITRKSSCVNARGIPTAAYQVLHLLPEVGYPTGRGTPGQV